MVIVDNKNRYLNKKDSIKTVFFLLYKKSAKTLLKKHKKIYNITNVYFRENLWIKNGNITNQMKKK